MKPDRIPVRNERGAEGDVIMKTLGLACAVALCTASSAFAAGLDGIWMRDDGNARVRIAPCGEKICATNLWIGDPSKGEAVGDKLVMTLSRQDDGSFAGTAYDQKRDMSYNMTVKVSSNELDTRGCVLGQLICRNVKWKSAE